MAPTLVLVGVVGLATTVAHAATVRTLVAAVVLHELAHWLGRPDWAHRRAFWGLAWQLYGRWMPHHLPYVAQREATWAKALAYCPFPELRP